MPTVMTVSFAITLLHRVVLFGRSFTTPLRAYLAAHPKNRYLFQTRLAGPFTPRRVEQIVKRYAEAAGVKATPHIFPASSNYLAYPAVRHGRRRAPTHYRPPQAGNASDLSARCPRRAA